MPLNLRWALMRSAAVLLAVTAACRHDQPPRAPAVPPKAPTIEQGARRVRDILARADRLEMRWAWSGLSADLLEPRAHTLVLKDGVIAGGAIPEPLFRQALARLAEARIVPGPYEPYFSHTDDYPDVSITVDAGPDRVRFFTQSQGRGHVPWGVEVDGQTYIVPSISPAEAFGLLIERLEPPEVAKRMMMPPPPSPPLDARELVHKAIVGNDVETVRRLLDAGQVRLDAAAPPLSYAAMYGRADIIELLVRAGAPVDGARPGGLTALGFAAGHGHVAAVRKLLDLGARDRRGLAKAVHEAATRGHPDIVRELIQAGADVNFSDEQGWRPILCVLVPDTLRLLLSAGARVDVRTSDGRTPLMVAVSPGCGSRRHHAEAVRMLIEAGASVNVTDGGQRTPLMWASILYGDPAIQRALLAAGAQVDARDAEGRTALFYAAGAPAIPVRRRPLPHAPSVAVLLEAGADVRARDGQGKTVLDYLGAAPSNVSSQGVRELLEAALR
jgi:ankyrin repeat protein